MKRTILIACLPLLWLGPAAGSQEQRATIVFESLTKDFGRVIEGETPRHTFKFKNKGNATLEIVKVEST